jgi:hypothetical protein
VSCLCKTLILLLLAGCGPHGANHDIGAPSTDLAVSSGADMANVATASDLAPGGGDLLAQSASLSLLAGKLGSPGSADGVGAAAQFNGPYGMASDGAGNLFVDDRSNNTIRSVVIATGAVTTLVGTAGMSGSADGTGAAARFGYPDGLGSDGAGNLFVPDTNNATIRQVVIATGVVTTLAGTPGMSGGSDGTGPAARFNDPTQVVSDGAGNLYVVDNFNDTIRTIVIATGVVTTLAGTAGMTGSADGTGAAARFSHPFGVATDGAGNLYVAEPVNNTIRKIVIATGVVTTLAGTAGTMGSADGTGAAARFNNPNGITSDGAGNLYVADYSNYTVRKIVIATGVVTTPIGVAGQYGIKLGPLPARLGCPTHVLALSTTDVAITDPCAHVVLLAHGP